MSMTALRKMAREEAEPKWADYHTDKAWSDAHERWRDLQKIADMVIPLGKRVDNPVRPDRLGSGRANFFTCKYFDGETRNCLDYEDRPKMCAEFPYGNTSCPYEGCRHFNGKIVRENQAMKRKLKVLSDKLPKAVLVVDKETLS